MCNTSAIYFQIFKPFGYKKLKNSEYYGTINIYNCSNYSGTLAIGSNL